MSALEVALWDIMGKHYGAPLYHLLGGKTRERIPTYNTCIGFGAGPGLRRLARGRRGAWRKSLLADGISAMKIWPFDQLQRRQLSASTSARRRSKQGLKPVRQIRDAVGADMEIGIECHFRWNRASMERIARALEPYDILFLEDVLPAVYPDEIKLCRPAHDHPDHRLGTVDDALADARVAGKARDRPSS